MSALYLFAGPGRKSGFAEALHQACKNHGWVANVTELDILRGGRSHDLLRPSLQDRYSEKVRKGEYDIVVASPPCNTFSRARGFGTGPQPLRSARQPRGLGHLIGKQARQVAEANKLVDYTAFLLQAQMETCPGLTVLEHPEDLGRTKSHTPGSIWRFPGVLGLLAVPGAVTGALRQCDFGTEYQKPTRLLGRLPGLEKVLSMGLPKYDEKDNYVGPLAPFDGPSSRLIGSEGRHFRTSSTAAWPEPMCARLAELTVETLTAPRSAEALANGEERGAETGGRRRRPGARGGGR